MGQRHHRTKPEKYFRALRKLGWRLETRRSGHRVWICPCGDKRHRVFQAASTSDSQRAMMNNVSLIRKTGCEFLPD